MKRSKVLSRNNRFPEYYNVEPLKSLQKAQAYLESMRASRMEVFCEYTCRLTVFAIKAPS